MSPNASSIWRSSSTVTGCSRVKSVIAWSAGSFGSRNCPSETDRRGSTASLKFVVGINDALFMKLRTSRPSACFLHAHANRERCPRCSVVYAIRGILIRALTIRDLHNDRSRRTVQRRTAQYLASLAPSIGPAAQILGRQPGELDDHRRG